MRRVMRVALAILATMAAVNVGAVILAPDWCAWMPTWLRDACGCADTQTPGGGSSGAGD